MPCFSDQEVIFNFILCPFQSETCSVVLVNETWHCFMFHVYEVRPIFPYIHVEQHIGIGLLLICFCMESLPKSISL